MCLDANVALQISYLPIPPVRVAILAAGCTDFTEQVTALPWSLPPSLGQHQGAIQLFLSSKERLLALSSQLESSSIPSIFSFIFFKCFYLFERQRKGRWIERKLSSLHPQMPIGATAMRGRARSLHQILRMGGRNPTI